MSFQFSARSVRNMQGVDQRLIDVAMEAIKISKIDFGIPSNGGLRTVEQQHELFKAGKSKADGYNKQSNHQTGRALDFYAYVDGAGSWDEYHLAMVAAAFLQAASQKGVALRWGGLFRSFKDYPHVELVED